MPGTNSSDAWNKQFQRLVPNQLLYDDLMQQLQPGSRLSIAASCFSIYAFHTYREQHEKLLRQIEALEKRCRAEKQTRKRYELHQQIVKLKELLAE